MSIGRGCAAQVPGDAAIWSCMQGCHTSFHLLCIQSWAKSEADRNAYRKVQHAKTLRLSV